MVSELTAAQAAAVAYVRGVALAAPSDDRLGELADAEVICDAIRRHGRVTLNFHPDRLLADGRTVAEALASDGVYRAQFETGISNGSRTAFPGGDRDGWERMLFGGAYHGTEVVAADRPKYGALNLLDHPDGAAPRFGSCHVRLRTHVNDRTTYTFGDSHLGPADIGTADAFRPILAALLESSRSGAALGVPITDLVDRLRALSATATGANPVVPAGRSLDDYIEAQVHGRIDLFTDVEAIVLDPSFRGTSTDRLLSGVGVPLEWHAGFVLDAGEVPADFRVPEMPAFAAAVAKHLDTNGRIDAAIVGMAAAENWSDWGDEDETRQLIKYLWHILVAYGRPA